MLVTVFLLELQDGNEVREAPSMLFRVRVVRAFGASDAVPAAW